MHESSTTTLQQNSTKELNVELQIYYRPNKEEFVISYGHTKGNPTTIGKGKTLSKALKDTAKSMPKIHHLPTRKRKLKNTKTTSLESKLYYNKNKDNYIISVTDRNGSKMTGEGHNTSTAFENLSEYAEVNRSI